MQITTIFVTHDQEEAMSISDRIICMSFAKVQQEGKPMDLYRKPKNEFVAKFLGSPEMLIINCPVKDRFVYFGQERILRLPSSYQEKQIDIGIRADGFVESDQGYLNATIKIIEYLGKEILVEAELPNQLGKASVSLKNKDQYKIGDQIKLMIKLNNINMFHPVTKERINYVVKA